MLILIEASFHTSVWCRKILWGLKNEARKKRVNLLFSSKIEDVDAKSEETAVMIVGSETKWLKLAACHVRAAGKHPIILSSQSETALDGIFSCVTVDNRGSMYAICDLFAAKGRKNLALYAVNPASASDACLKDGFLSAGGFEKNIFINDGALSVCFQKFYEKHKAIPYDGIICTNDFAAISLIRHLKNNGETIENTDLISYSNTLISQCTSPPVSSVMTNYDSFGQLAFMIADCLSKADVISGIHMLCGWKIIHRETTEPPSPNVGPQAVTNSASESASGKFYNDPELVDMMKIESLLSQCDSTDIRLLAMILDDRRLSEMEEACFLTETAIKYRIRKMKECCKVSSRTQLRDFLGQYVSDTSCLSALSEKTEDQ